MSTFIIEAGRKRRATVTLEEQPGAHTGSTRKYIPGYSDSNIVYLDTVSGNDANSGATELLSKRTYASAATAAGSTKKIRVINSGATLSTNITKPTEMKRGLLGTISSSLTAPVDTWVLSGSSTTATSFAWCESLAKMVCVGNGTKFSSDLSTWTSAATPLSGASYVIWVRNWGKAYAINQSGVVAESSDLNAWATIKDFGGSWTLRSIVYSEERDCLYVIEDDGRAAKYDGSAWEITSERVLGSTQIRGAAWCNELSAAVVVGIEDYSGNDIPVVYTTSDFSYYTQMAIPYTSKAWLGAVIWDEKTQKAIIGGGEMNGVANTFILTSSDLSTWTEAASVPTLDTNDYVYGLCSIPELGLVVASTNSATAANSILYSSDLTTWIKATTMPQNAMEGIGYSPLLGKAIVSGSSNLYASTAFANTVSANIAGFTVQAMQYSGTVTAYNCTLKQPGTTANLSTENCRITESGAHISSNSQSHSGLLVDGDIHFTTNPSVLGNFSLNRFTIAGKLKIYNSSSTYNERIRDGIITDGIDAAYAVVVDSGNIRGTCKNTVFGLDVSTSDPAFVDLIDYQLKREVNGYDEDSICVAKSAYYYSSIGTRRDIGAWSYREENSYNIYERAYEMRKPGAKDSTRHVERLQTSLYWGEDMTPDVASDPEARGEELVLNYRTLPIADIVFIRYLRTLKDQTVRIDYDPQFAATSSVTVDGNQSIGTDVLQLLTSTLQAGQKLTISGKTYLVMRMNGTTKAILDKPLEDAVTDTQVLTVSDTPGKGEFQFVPESEMNLTRFYENNTEYLKGVKVQFVRKSP